MFIIQKIKAETDKQNHDQSFPKSMYTPQK